MSDPGNPMRPQVPTGNGGQEKARQAGEDLRAAAREAREAAGQAASTVGAEASKAAETLKREGADLLDTAKQRAEGMAQEGVQAGAEQARGIARAIHRAAEELDKDSPALGRTVHEAAGAVENMARALRERGPGDLLRSAEDFARRQPLAFFSAAALAGFALTRFARASAAHHHDEHGVGMRPGGPRYGTYPAQGGRSHQGMHAKPHAGTAGMSTHAGDDEPDTATLVAGPEARAAANEPHAGPPGGVTHHGDTPRPATLASASLGGAAVHGPRGDAGKA